MLVLILIPLIIISFPIVTILILIGLEEWSEHHEPTL